MVICIRLVCFLVLMLGLKAEAQSYIGKTRSKVIKELHNIMPDGYVTEDSVLKIAYVDPGSGNVEKLFKFDKSGKCYSEKVKASCESCFNALLNSVLQSKKYEWKKINENQYISKYSEFMMIELPVEPGDYSFHVFHTEWNKELYRMLTGN